MGKLDAAQRVGFGMAVGVGLVCFTVVGGGRGLRFWGGWLSGLLILRGYKWDGGSIELGNARGMEDL